MRMARIPASQAPPNCSLPFSTVGSVSFSPASSPAIYSCECLQDLKDVFSHDVIEGLGAAGSDSGAIRAEAYKAAREAKQALLSRTLSAPSRPVAPAPPPRFILFGAATSSAAMSSTWARRTVACKSPACVSLRKRGKAKRACGVCSSLPNCALNYQPFGRNYFRSSFLIRSHVSLYEATELEGVVSSEPSAMLGGAPLTAVYSKVTRHPGPKSVRTVTLGVRPAPHLSAQLTRSLTDGTAAYFGGTSTSQMTPYVNFNACSFWVFVALTTLFLFLMVQWRSGLSPLLFAAGSNAGQTAPCECCCGDDSFAP